MKNITRKIFKDMNICKFFAYSIIFFLFASIFVFILTGGTYWNRLFWQSNNHPFSDFYLPIKEAYLRRPYINTNISPYPPMAFFIFYIISLIVEKTSLSIPWYDFHQYQSFVFLYFIILLSLIFMFLYVCILLFEKNGKKTVSQYYIFLFLLLSYQFLYAYERGNIVILCVLLCMIYILFYDSKDIKQKSIAFIALAIASSIKIYPAIFGLLILPKKRIKDITLLIILGIVFFTLPFVFFIYI